MNSAELDEILAERDALRAQLTTQTARAEEAERKLHEAETTIYGYLSTRQAEERAAKAEQQNAALRSAAEEACRWFNDESRFTLAAIHRMLSDALDTQPALTAPAAPEQGKTT